MCASFVCIVCIAANASSAVLLSLRYPHALDFKNSVEYCDYTDRDDGWIATQISEEREKGWGSGKEKFPTMLHFMISSLETSGHSSDIIYWQQHGRAFMIQDRKRFVNELLPVFFIGQKKFASFQRQLNNYGFLRLTGPGPDRNAYYHPLFLRARPELCPLVTRHCIAANSTRQTFDPTTEPNFYILPRVTAIRKIPLDCASASAVLTGVLRAFDPLSRTIIARGDSKLAPTTIYMPEVSARSNIAHPRETIMMPDAGTASLLARKTTMMMEGLSVTPKSIRGRLGLYGPCPATNSGIEYGAMNRQVVAENKESLTSAEGLFLDDISVNSVADTLSQLGDWSECSVDNMALWLEDVDLDDSSQDDRS